ncbi:GBF-interacting protein 1 [Senna tora]|uniref:GBF-interacting protein 1 n=1 Tax=Senna tora TaxID=362788 RepID=A0A834WWB0_9FABA|nr:GBF-interacting protein 1 [Senna tora]
MGSESKDKIGERGGGAAQGMPAATKKVVQSLKEIANCTDCTDQEIYAVLEECDMDPGRAVERLLAQDTFHEVKSKRERRKEMKEASDSRSRHSNVGSTRGGKTGSERIFHGGSTHVTYSELGKAADRGEIGSVCPSVTSSMTRVIVKDTASNSSSADNGRQLLGSSRVSPGLKPTFLGVSKGHLSMADVVRMGKPSQDAVSYYHSKAPGVSASARPDSSLSLHHYNQSGQQDINHERPVIEQPVSGTEPHASKMSALSNVNLPSDHLNLQSNTDSLLRNHVSGEAQVSQGDVSDNVNSEKIESGFLTSRHTIMNNAGLASHFNYNLKNSGATDSHSSSAHQEDVSSAASDFQRLSLRDSKMEVPSTEDSSTLVLPNHVSGLTAQCSHLSFGRYNGGSNSTSTAMLASHLSSDLEEKAAAVDGGSLAQYLDSSNSAYCSDKFLGHDVFKEAAIDKKYDFLSSCQQELVKRTFPEATLGHEYTTMSSVPDPSFQKSQWVTPSLPFKRSDLQNGNMTTSREMVMESHFSQPHRSALLQDLTVQSSLHLDQYADKKGYNPLTQNHRYMAAMNAQQPFSGSSAYNHSLEDMKYGHPQNRNELLMSRLPPSRGRDAFGYGNTGSSYNPGSFLPNSSLSSMMPSSNFDEILPSQYNGGRSLNLFQQNGSSSMWDYEPESRSLTLPERTQYNSLGQPNQALSQYINSGYSNLYPSEARIAAELERQSGSQDLPSKQYHQFGNAATNSLLSANILSPFYH